MPPAEPLTCQRLVRRRGPGPCTGVVVERTREQLNAILDHFSITIDNPLSVLSQEVAKRFLASAKPADLYKARRACARRGARMGRGRAPGRF